MLIELERLSSRGESERERKRRTSTLWLFREYLEAEGLVEPPPNEPHVYDPVLWAYEQWLRRVRGACPGRIERRRQCLVINLKLDDIVLTGGAKINVMAKGKKPRACVLWDDTVQALQACLELRSPRKRDDTHVFLNAVGDPLSRFGVTHILKNADLAEAQCPSIAAKNITPHVMRHSTAMHLLLVGIEVAMIALWLGHARLETTNKYVECNMDMKRAMIEGVEVPNAKPPRRKWHTPKTLEWLDSLANPWRFM